VITVGSINDAGTGFWGDDRVSDTSNWGNADFAPGMEKPEVVAVGEGIRTTDAAGGDWLTPDGVNGTSYAAPQVAGQIALMLSRQPEQNIWPETNKAAVLASAFHDVEAGQERDGVGAVMINVSDDTYRLNRFINGSTAAGGPLQASDFPRNYEDAITLEQNQRVRVAIAWDSISNGTTSDVLGADLDLCIRHPDNATIIACSTSRDNAWELVEFTAPASGQYDVLITLNQVDAGWPGTFLGVAWAIRSLPNVCANALDLPVEGGTFTANTAHGSAFFDTYTGWTRGQGGRERVMRLVLDTTKDIAISDTNPNLDLHLVQFPTCAGDPVEPVVRGSGLNSVSLDNARSGIYYLIVDGANGAVGTTSVTVRVSGP
jgi:hypothetical protein